MYIYLSKILPLFIMPIGIVLELLLLAFFLLRRRKRKPATFTLAIAIVVLWGSSLPIVGNTLLGFLERQYPAIPISDVASSECIVVLGGAVGPVQSPRLDVDLKDAADRVYKTASLYAAGKAPMIIVAGGNQPWSPFEQSEAEAIRLLLMEWGVPDSAIFLDETSRNTRENVVNTWEILRTNRCVNPLLVTSAAHMPRSVASFEMVGIRVFPVSVDVRVVRKPKLSIFDFLPDTDALKKTTDAMHEWVGQQYYKLRGWS